MIFELKLAYVSIRVQAAKRAEHAPSIQFSVRVATYGNQKQYH
jgi:hypothetical protein